MKTRKNGWLICFVGLGLCACEKKQEAVAPGEVKPSVVEQAVEKATEVLKPAEKVESLSAEERAAKLGFAKHVAGEADYLISFYDGSKTMKRAKEMKLWKVVSEQIFGGMGAEDIDVGEEASDEAEEVGPAVLFGKEFSLVLGKPSGEQAGHLMTINQRMTYFQMRGLAKTFATAAKDGDTEAMMEAMGSGYSPELLRDMLGDAESGMDLVEALRMPPITAAFRVSSAKLEESAMQVGGMLSSLQMLGEMVEPLEAEKAGAKFTGFKISGKKLSETAAQSREMLEGMVDAAMVDRLLAAIAKNDIVIATGTVGEYVVMFVGASMDDLRLAEDAGKSILAGSEFGFFDAHAGKELSAVIYADEAAAKTVYDKAGGVAAIVDGLRDGIAGAEGLGETRDLEAMFQLVSEREAALKKLIRYEAQGVVAFFEEGLKIESYGGMDSGALDWKKPSQLAHLGSSSDVVLFANLNTTEAYDEKSREYFEALLETAYGIALKVAEMPLEGEFAEYAGMAKMVDAQFRGDAIALWQSLSGDLGDGLGKESAFIMDLKGAAPAVPGVPQKVVDEAKVPRISVVSPVVDRARLAASWEQMNGTMTGVLGKVSEMTGQKIPMQKPLSSEKNGLTTWFFPLPFFNDDFLPSVTVGEKWFAASSSKNQALDLIAQAEGGGAAGSGFQLALDFKALGVYAKEMAKVVDENAEAMLGEALTAEQKELIEDSIEAFGELDRMTVHSRRDQGVLRTSMHFKTVPGAR